MVNEEFLQAVRNQQYYHFGNIVDVSGYGWFDFVRLVATHPNANTNWVEEKQRVELDTVASRPRLPDFAKDILKTLNDTFNDIDVTTTLVTFAGFTKDHKSLEIHADSMDVLYLQVLGEVVWSVWETDLENARRIQPDQGTKVFEKHFTPGDLIWIPRGMLHHVKPLTGRVGFSFGVEGDNPAWHV